MSDSAEPTSLTEMFSSAGNSSISCSGGFTAIESRAESSDADKSSMAESSASSLPGIIEARAANGSSLSAAPSTEKSSPWGAPSAACGSSRLNSSDGASILNSSLISIEPFSPGILKSVSEISPAIAAAATLPTTTSYSSFQKVFSGSMSCRRR